MEARAYEADYILNRLINDTNTAEGSIVPLRVIGGTRVPTVTNLRVVKTERIERGTQITLAWQDIEPFDRLSHYIVSTVEYSTVSQNPIGSNIARQSPIKIRILGDEDVPITLTVQTVLLNGQSSRFTESPSVSTHTIEDFIEPGDQQLAYQPQAPDTYTVTFSGSASNNFFNETGSGRILGFGVRFNTATTTGATKDLSLQFSIDGGATTTIVLTTSTLVWDNTILSCPGDGNMGTVGNWRYYPLNSTYNTNASVTAVYATGVGGPDAAQVQLTIYWEKTA